MQNNNDFDGYFISMKISLNSCKIWMKYELQNKFFWCILLVSFSFILIWHRDFHFYIIYNDLHYEEI